MYGSGLGRLFRNGIPWGITHSLWIALMDFEVSHSLTGIVSLLSQVLWSWNKHRSPLSLLRLYGYCSVLHTKSHHLLCPKGLITESNWTGHSCRERTPAAKHWVTTYYKDFVSRLKTSMGASVVNRDQPSKSRGQESVGNTAW